MLAPTAGRGRQSRASRLDPVSPASTASLYLRLSRESTQEGTGLTTQEADLRALAASRGLTVVTVHTDDGESGALRNRPGLLAWLADAREGRADHLLAWKLDRVSRGGSAGLAEFLDVLSGVDRDGRPVSPPARFLSVADGLDSESPAWGIQAGVMGEIAKAERDATTARVRRSVAERKRQGRFIGGPSPYGTRVVDNPDGPGRVLAVEPVEADALREALRRLHSGDSPARVARWMTDHGPKPRRAKEWKRQTLVQALTSDAATRLVFTPADRRAIRDLVASREPRESYVRKPARLLSGVLRCSGCGASLSIFHRPDGYVSYRCQTRSRGGGCSGAISVGADLIEAGVSDLWLDGWGCLPETVAVRAADESADVLAAAEDEVEMAAAAVVALRGADRLAALERLEALEAVRDTLAAQPASSVSYLRETGRSYADVWAAGTLEDRRDALLRTVGGLVVGPGARGRRGFDVERVLDAWRLDPASPQWIDEAAA
jgi:DNA invertase Pin-like site-specific DNA recombinase